MALSYSDKANIEKGVATGTAVTLQETIAAAIRDIGGAILKGTLTLAAVPNNTGITQAGLNECGLRMSRGGLAAEIMPMALADAAITNGSPTDANIQGAVTYAIWPIALLITNGKA
jgi:hypothetical protein